MENRTKSAGRHRARLGAIVRERRGGSRRAHGLGVPRPGSGPLVTVWVNAGRREVQSRIACPVPFAGFTPWLTSAADSLRELPAARAGDAVVVPAESVMTLVFK
jgi:hypothetical protein